MKEILEIIPNCDKIIIYNNRITDSVSLMNAEYFYHFIYDRYFLDKEYHTQIITDINQYQGIGHGNYRLSKYLYLWKGIFQGSMAFANASLLIMVDGNIITITKYRYTTEQGLIGNIKDLPIYQRKDKLNKILDNIKNETRITEKIDNYIS
jgi:hypothetical protein